MMHTSLVILSLVCNVLTSKMNGRVDFIFLNLSIPHIQFATFIVIHAVFNYLQSCRVWHYVTCMYCWTKPSSWYTKWYILL